MAKNRKASTPFEDPTIAAFYQQVLGNASTTVGPAHTYNWSNQDLQKATHRAVGKPARAKQSSGQRMSAMRYSSVRQLQQSVANERAKNARYGGTNEDTHKRNGLLARVLDVISRPNYGVMQGIKRAENYGRKHDASFIGNVENFGKGFWQGFSGKKKTTGSDLLRYEFPGFTKAHRKTTALAGLAMDIGLDPTTYVGFGLASKVGKIGKVTQTSNKMRDTLKAIGVTDENTIRTLSHAAYTEGKQTRAAAKAAKKTVDEAADFASKIEGDKVYKSILNSGGDVRTATAKSQIAKGNMQVQLRKMADDILNAPGYRNIALKVGSGLGQKGLEIPLSRFAVQAAAAPFKGLGHWDPAARAASKFEELFSNSAKIFPELQQMRLEHRSSGLARVHARGEFLTKTFRPFSKDQREQILTDALNGNTASGVIIKDATGAPRDAADLVLSRLRATQAQFASTMIHHDLILEPEDVNRFSKYAGLTFKKANKNDQNWIINSLKNSNIKDAGEALFIVESSMEQALSRRTMLKSFADTWGARAGTIPDIAKKYGFSPKNLPPELRPFKNHKMLAAQGWRMVKNQKTGKPIKELDGILFDPDTAHGMERILNLLDDEREIAGMLRSINNLTGKWKFFVTVPNPGFHIRNSIGDMYVNLMDSVGNAAYDKAGKLITNKKQFEAPGAGQINPLMQTPHESMMSAARAFQPANPSRYRNAMIKFKTPLKDETGRSVDKLSEAEIWAAYNRYGMRQNYTISEYGRAFDEKRLMGRFSDKLKDPFVRFSENREDYFRLAHFIHLIQKNPEKTRDLDKLFAFAAQRVRETHFDYTDFTKFEKQGMSNLIPFYKWTRKSLPLQTELLFTQPGRVAYIPKAMRAVSEMMGYDWQNWNYLNTEKVIPQWMRDTGYMPGNFDALPGLKGPQQYFNVASPFGDATTQWGTPVSNASLSDTMRSASSMLNPAIKGFGEIMFNKRAFTGQQIYDPNDPSRGHKFTSIMDYLTEQTPITRIAGKAAQKEDTTPAAAWSWLLGLSIQPNTQARQMSELYRQRDNTRGRYAQTRSRYVKKHKLKPDTRLR